MRDHELLRLLRDDPEVGFGQLMDLYMGLVYAVVKARLGDIGSAEDIEDCVSESFAEFYRSLSRIDLRSGTIKAYLCAIARNRAIDCYSRLAAAGGDQPLEDEPLRGVLTDGSTPEEALITAEMRHAVAEAIAALGYPDREILVRKYLLGESSRSIARRLHLSVSAVDTRTHRALKKLRTRLEDKP